MGANTRDSEAAMETDEETRELSEMKRKTRKRKENKSDTSDSETIKRTTRTKRKPAASSHSEAESDADTQKQPKYSLHASAKQLVTLLDNVRGHQDIKTARKLASQICDMAVIAEEENAALKRKISSANNINEKMEAMDATLSNVVKTIKELTKAQKPQTPMTYAERLKTASATSLEAAKNTRRHVITVFPGEDSQIADSNETKQKVISAVAPTKEKLKIVNVRKISNKGILIETKTEEDLKRVLENSKLKAAGLNAGLPAKMKPRLLIRNVPTDLQEKEIIAAVRSQNLDQYSKDQLTEHFKLAFKTGPKDRETVDWVAEVSPAAREKILKEGRVYIGWHACHAQDFVAVTRCYKCQSFGHVAKHCKASEDTCGHCAGNGHSQKSCPKIKEDPKCVNCKRAGKIHDHSSRSKECPAYQNAVRTYISKIDYGRK